jgi:hypothetical protein
MMKNHWILLLTLIVIGGITTGIGTGSSQNNTNDTTAALINMTNASSSVEDAQNMSVIEGTMNATK